MQPSPDRDNFTRLFLRNPQGQEGVIDISPSGVLSLRSAGFGWHFINKAGVNVITVTENGITGVDLDIDPIFIDAVNKRVGIVTVAPAEKLDVTGNIKIRGPLTNGLIFADGTTQVTAAGGGTVGPGTINTLAKFTAANVVGDSLLAETAGVVTASAVLRANAGTGLLPAFSFAVDPDTGVFRAAGNTLGFACGGSLIGQFKLNGIYLVDGADGTPSYSFINDPDTGFFSPGANVIGLSTGGVLRATFTDNGLQLLVGTVGLPSLVWEGDPTTGFFHASANEVAYSAGGTETARFWDKGIILTVGTAGFPSYSFSGDTNSGIFSAGANLIGLAVNGVEVTRFAGQGILNADGTVLLPSFSFLTDPATGLYFGGAGILNVATGGVKALSIFYTGADPQLVVGNGAANPTLTLSGGSSSKQIIADATSDTFQFLIGGLEIVRFNTSTQVLHKDGSAALPPISFLSDPNTGIFSVAADKVGISANAIEQARITVGGLHIGAAGDPSSTLHVQGSVATAFRADATTPDTMTITDSVLAKDATGGAITVNLPTAVGIAGRVYTILKSDVSLNTVTIDADGTETINGSLTQILATQYAKIAVVSDGANWFII